MSKISFLTYLTHYNFMKVIESGFSYTYYYSFATKWMSYLIILMISMLFSILITILIEAPFIVLQKKLIQKIKEA
jgi:peptidoglycan/LPS O-acetylase OafA/YrhL